MLFGVMKFKIRMTVRWSAVAAKIEKERAKQKEHIIMVSTIHIP